MRRKLSFVTVVVLFTTLVGFPPALAQTDAPAGATITTTGFGEASVPAESVDLQILIVNEDSFYGGPPSAPVAEATPGAAARSSVAPIVDAITAHAGVESVEVVVPLASGGYGGPTPIARLDVAVANPDADGLASLINAATQAGSNDRMLIGFVGARFFTSDCGALELAAREAALDDARYRAQIQADLLGIGLSDIVSTVDVVSATSAIGYYGRPAGSASGCDPDISMDFAGGYLTGATLPAFDPATQPSEVTAYRSVEVTFSMTGAEATPAA